MDIKNNLPVITTIALNKTQDLEKLIRYLNGKSTIAERILQRKQHLSGTRITTLRQTR